MGKAILNGEDEEVIKQITTAGCNREVFALTDDGELFLLVYRTEDDNGLKFTDQLEALEWRKIEGPPEREQ